MDRVIFQRLFPKSNVARGNWTSPVLYLLPYGVLAVNQQDRKMYFYKHSYKHILQTSNNQSFIFSNYHKIVIKWNSISRNQH